MRTFSGLGLALGTVGAIVLFFIEMRDRYDFEPGKLEEAGSALESKSQKFWLSSGGYFFAGTDGVGRTVFGTLSENDPWRLKYNAPDSNPRDTENGFRPQNIFRLYTREKFENFEQSITFRIKTINLTTTEERGEWSGFWLMNRAESEDHLYYTGVCTGGAVMIKKKNGRRNYVTLASARIFEGSYDKFKNPNLIPQHWTGFQSKVSTLSENKVKITVSIYFDGRGWIQVVEATDDGEKGGPPILQAGNLGIRTDFMDVEFYDYRISIF